LALLEKLKDLTRWGGSGGERGEAEERSTLNHPAPWLSDALMGASSPSGARVNASTAISVPAVWSAIRVLADSLSSLPFHLRERVPGGGTRDAENHPVFRVLYVAPNPRQTPREFWGAMHACVIARGNAYAQVIRDNGGRVRELLPLHPARMRAVLTDSGEVGYVYVRPDGTSRLFAAGELLRLHGLSFDGVEGVSPLTAHRRALGLAIDSEESAARFYGNGARPGLSIKLPDGIKLSEEARVQLKAELAREFEGSANAFRTMVLDQGADVAQIGLAPGDMQFLESRTMQVREVARIFRVPPHLLGDLADATFSNVEQMGQEFVTYSLMPHVVAAEQAVRRDLLTEAEQLAYTPKLNVSALLRGDAQTRASFYSTMTQNGLMSSNEARALEDLNPSEQQGADDLRVQSALVPLDLLGTTPNEGSPAPANNGEQRSQPVDVEVTETPPEPDGFLPAPEEARAEPGYTARLDAHERIKETLSAAATELLKEELATVRKLVAEAGTITELRIGVEELYARRREVAREVLAPAFQAALLLIAEAAAAEVGKELTRGATLDRFIEGVIDARAARWVRNGRKQLLDLAEEEEPRAAITERLDSWEQERAATYAEKQSTEVGGAAAQFAWAAVGVAAMQWRTRGDNCPVCNQLNGKQVRLGTGEPFAQEGSFLPGRDGSGMKASRTTRHPPIHKGCNCFLTPSV